jgi:hypothetical protein
MHTVSNIDIRYIDIAVVFTTYSYGTYTQYTYHPTKWERPSDRDRLEWAIEKRWIPGRVVLLPPKVPEGHCSPRAWVVAVARRQGEVRVAAATGAGAAVRPAVLLQSTPVAAATMPQRLAAASFLPKNSDAVDSEQSFAASAVAAAVASAAFVVAAVASVGESAGEAAVASAAAPAAVRRQEVCLEVRPCRRCLEVRPCRHRLEVRPCRHRWDGRRVEE